MRVDINQSNIDCKLIIGHRSDSAWHVTNIITLCSDLVNHLPCDSLNKRSESGSRVPRVTERVECCRAPRWPCRPRFSLRAVFLPSLPWDAIAAGRIYKSSNKTFPSTSLFVSPSTGNLRLARKVAPKGDRENELLFIIAAQSTLAPYALAAGVAEAAPVNRLLGGWEMLPSPMR